MKTPHLFYINRAESFAQIQKVKQMVVRLFQIPTERRGTFICLKKVGIWTDVVLRTTNSSSIGTLRSQLRTGHRVLID